MTEIEKLKTVLEKARHVFVTMSGLHATDRLSVYQEALQDGCDANGAWDRLMECVWEIDMSAIIAEIDVAIDQDKRSGVEE